MAPLFSRRHYKVVADILSEIKNETSIEAHKKLTRRFIRLFAGDNGRFDEEQFLFAVGYNDRI